MFDMDAIGDTCRFVHSSVWTLKTIWALYVSKQQMFQKWSQSAYTASLAQ